MAVDLWERSVTRFDASSETEIVSPELVLVSPDLRAFLLERLPDRDPYAFLVNSKPDLTAPSTSTVSAVDQASVSELERDPGAVPEAGPPIGTQSSAPLAPPRDMPPRSVPGVEPRALVRATFEGLVTHACRELVTIGIAAGITIGGLTAALTFLDVVIR